MASSGNPLGSLLVRFGADSSALDEAIKSMVEGVIGAGEKITKLGSTLETAIPYAAIAAAATEIGKKAIEAGEVYETAFNTIIAKTGATGDQLNSLKDSFEKVFLAVPGDAQSVATSISLISDRLHIAGDDLENFAAQLGQLSSFSGASMAPLTDSITKAFQNWGVATDEQKDKLDFLNAVSQRTGTDITQLAGTMASIGNLARLSGVSFEETALQVGLLNSKGVDAETVFQGISKAIATANKAGIDLGTVTLPNLVFSIEQGIKSGNGLAVALEEFGAKAGPKMYELVRDGIVSSASLMTASLDKATDSVKKTFEATDTLGREFALLGKNMLSMLAPLGETVLGWAKDFLSSTNTIMGSAMGQEDALKKLGEQYAAANSTAKTYFDAETGNKAASEALAKTTSDLGITITGLSAPLVDVAAKMEATKAAAAEQKKAWAEVQKAALGFTDASSQLAIFLDDVKHAMATQDLSGYKNNVDAAAKAIVAARDGTATFWKEIENTSLALDFNNSVLAAMPDLARQAIAGTDGLGNSLMNVFDRTDQANLMLNTHMSILQRLGIVSTAALQAEADAITEDVQRLASLLAIGEATQQEYNDAVAKMIAANAKLGDSITGTEQLWVHTKTTVTDFGKAAKTVLNDLSRGLADAIVQGKSLGAVFLKVAQDISAAIIKYAIEQGTKLLISSLGGVLSQLGSIGAAIAKVFGGGGASAAAKIATPPFSTTSNIPGIGGAAGGAAAGAGSAVSSGLMGVLGPVGAIGSAISAVTGILSLFGVGQGGQKDRLDIIANNTSDMDWAMHGPGGLWENTWYIHSDIGNLLKAFTTWYRDDIDAIKDAVQKTAIGGGSGPNVVVNIGTINGNASPQDMAQQLASLIKRYLPATAAVGV